MSGIEDANILTTPDVDGFSVAESGLIEDFFTNGIDDMVGSISRSGFLELVRNDFNKTKVRVEKIINFLDITDNDDEINLGTRLLYYYDFACDVILENRNPTFVEIGQIEEIKQLINETLIDY